MTTAPRVSRGAVQIISGAALFGTIGTARLLGPDASAASVGSLRLLLGAAALMALAWPAGLWQLAVAARMPAVWAAGIAQAAFNITFFGAVTHAGVAVGTLVAIGCTPILTGLLSRRITPGWLAATLLAVLGLAALLSDGIGGTVAWDGVLFALGASASYASFIVASARLTVTSARDVAPLPTAVALAAIFCVAAVVLSPALLLTDLGWSTSGGGLAMLAYLSLAATVGAYSLFNRGLRTVEPGPAATLGLTEPLVAALLGVLVLGERLSLLSWIGAVIVLCALVVMIRVSRPPVDIREDRVDEHV